VSGEGDGDGEGAPAVSRCRPAVSMCDVMNGCGGFLQVPIKLTPRCWCTVDSRQSIAVCKREFFWFSRYQSCILQSRVLRCDSKIHCEFVLRKQSFQRCGGQQQ
jgi:hypothetical protein